MRVMFKTSVTAALSLILGAGVLRSQAALVSVAGGNSTTVGGWRISPNRGINLNITGVNSNKTLVVQGESATFDNNGPLNVTFKQLSADAVANFEFQGATKDSATGQDWSGFTFSLTGSASFDGPSTVFVPLSVLGVDYNVATLNAPTTVKYSGTQLSNVVSTWGGTSSDDLIIAADPSDNTAYAYDSAFALSQAPIVSEVRAPLAAWQSLTGLIVVIFITLIRPPKPVSII
jgi:hypothetical protein